MIGIVGGIGPLAGVDLFRKITEETQGNSDQEHPSILLFSLPSEIPDRTEFLIGKEKENPAYPISKILLDMEKSGVTVAGIMCNTAHSPAIFDVIEKELKVHGSNLVLMHIIREVMAEIRQKYSNVPIGILATTGSIKTGLYRETLEKIENPVIEPDLSWQKRIHKAIYDKGYGIKSKSSPVTAKAEEELRLALTHLKEKGAKAFILGCTEIPLAILESKYQGLPIIDPNRLFARALLKNSKVSPQTKVLVEL